MGNGADGAPTSTSSSSTDQTDWRGWLEFQLQLKRHDTFVAMERTGEAPWRVLDALRARLRSSSDVAVHDKAVDSYRHSGGSQRGAVYKALEALTQRHCPRGTRQKLQAEMDALRKHHGMTVDVYTASFHQLLDMYTLLSMQDGLSLSAADVCRLYSNGMPRVWQDRVDAELQHGGACGTVGEFEVWFKRLEREEREEEEYQSRKRHRADADQEHDDGRTGHPFDRRLEAVGCSYCREFRYGHVYKTHSDEQCYRNPKNNHTTYSPRFVPRGKCVAVFGSGVKKSDEDSATPALDLARPDPSGICGTESRPSGRSDEVVKASGACEQPTCESKVLTDAGDATTVTPARAVVKQEPELDNDDSPANQLLPQGTVAVASSELLSDCDLVKHPSDIPVKCSADVLVKCSNDTATPEASIPLTESKGVKLWEEIVLAMVGPFGQTDWCVLVFVDAATQFVELCPVVHATSEEITHAIDQEWLSRYPWPARFIYSARVPAYDPAFSHLKSRCGAYGTLPVAEPAQTNSALSVMLLHVHMVIELKVINMHPQSHADWAGVVSVARHDLRTNSIAPITTADSHSNECSSEPPIAKKMKQDPLCQQDDDQASITHTSDPKGCQHDLNLAFAPDDMVLVEYREVRRCIGLTPRREGPYRVEAVRTNGILVIDKGKYLEQIHARRAVLVR